MAKKTEVDRPQFEVIYNITLDLGVTIIADSLEDAIERGRQLGVCDLIDLGTHTYNDGTVEVSGVWKR